MSLEYLLSNAKSQGDDRPSSEIRRYNAVAQEIFHPPVRVDARLSDLPAHDAPQESPRLTIYRANWRALLSRFLELVLSPKEFVPVIADCFFLIRSTWTGRQLGPDFVYPMLGVKKRQSGYLGKLILEHSRDQRSYELRVAGTLLPGVHPLCVAVIDLGQVALDVVDGGYSTPANFYGIACMMALMEVTITLMLHVFYGQDEEFVDLINNWCTCFFVVLVFCCAAAFFGEGTLTLTRPSQTLALGCAVLLDQDFTLFLNGNRGVVEAVTESNINLSYNSTLGSTALLDGEEPHPKSFYDILEKLCEGLYLAVLMLCCFMVSSFTIWSFLVLFAVFANSAIPIIHYSRRMSLNLGLPSPWFALTEMALRILPTYYLWLCQYSPRVDGIHFGQLAGWHAGAFFTYFFLSGLPAPGRNTQNYPIGTTKLLDVLGHPHVRKWQFSTLAAAATFQCLVLCHGIARPVGRHIDVLAFLDVLVPDDTDVWRVWKKRVADRIVHEQDITFTPTIPTFRDDHEQEKLVDLLHQAQSGYWTYMELYGRDAPPEESKPTDDASSPSIPSLFYFSFRRLLSFAPFIDRSRLLS